MEISLSPFHTHTTQININVTLEIKKILFKSHWIVPLSWLARGEITFGHWGEVSLEGGWAGYGKGTSIHSNLHGGDREGGRWVVWLGDWRGDVTPRYIRLSFSVSAVSPLMNNTNATNYTKIGDNLNYHH